MHKTASTGCYMYQHGSYYS